MTKEVIVKILDNNGIYLGVDDIESLGNAMRDICEEAADEMTREEPHATNSIERIREAGREIESILQP